MNTSSGRSERDSSDLDPPDLDPAFDARQWRSIFDGLPEAVFVVGLPMWTIRFVNRAAALLFDHPREALVGSSGRLLHLDHQAFLDFDRASAEALARGEVFRTEWQMRRRDGSTFDSEHVVAVLGDDEDDGDDERRRWAVSLVRDASNRVRRENDLDWIRLRELNRRLLETQETERLRIARELHDESAQLVSYLHLQLAAIPGCKTEAEREEVLGESREALDRLSSQLRDLAVNLRPPMLDSLGLVPSVRWYLGHVLKNASMDWNLQLGDKVPELCSTVRSVGFRVVQEALANVIRHAGASRVTVSIDCVEEQLRLVVEDDGEGFDTADLERVDGDHRSLGFLGIRERLALIGGRLEIESELGEGTTLRAHLPLDATLRSASS